VIGLDVIDSQLEEAKACGADHVFNPKTQPAYAHAIKKLTSGGCHAVVNYTASKASYDRAPDVLRINGILMVVGHPQQMLTFSSIDIALGKFKVMGASNSIPANLKECIDFSVEHGIKPHITYYRRLEDIYEMIELVEQGKVRGRVAIRFD
jgi:propanol-preferring alcohol dehydrogenase